MSKMLKLTAVFLAIGTVVLTMAVVYVTGVEQGVNSRQPEIAKLYQELYPGILIDWGPYLHPLRNFLFGSALFIGICWIALFISACAVMGKSEAYSRRTKKGTEPTGNLQTV